MWYRDTRDVKNWFIAQFETVGRYDIPVIHGISTFQPCSFVGYNDAKTLEKKDDKACHFWIDDYQFYRVWDKPDKAADVLSDFKYVLTPDFSIFTDYPEAIRIYNHYRKHWCGAYWQSLGINVIPTIDFSDERSFDWCFDGEPHNSVVALSTVCNMKDAEEKRRFCVGYNKMMEVLEPSLVIAYGYKFDGLDFLDRDNVKKVYNRRFK